MLQVKMQVDPVKRHIQAIVFKGATDFVLDRVERTVARKS